MNTPRRALLAVSCGLLALSACGDSGGTSSTTDTLAADTSVASDTVTPTDTQTGADTVAPTDTVAVDDTSAPADTGGPDDTVAGDTGTPTDTLVPDTTGPAPQCFAPGVPCDDDTLPSPAGELICSNPDTNAPDTQTCSPVCETNEDCPGGTLCVDDEIVHATAPVCVHYNCTSILASETECAGAGPQGGTCIMFTQDAGLCVPAGTASAGEACEADDDCASGQRCLDGACATSCSLADDSAPCGDGEGCQDFGLVGGVGLCLDFCPGFASTAGTCGEGQGCRPTGAEDGFCVDVGTQGVGDPCGEDQACGEQLWCTRIQDTDPRTCHAMCDRDNEDLGDSYCAAGEGCFELDTINAIGGCFPGCTPFVSEDENGCTEANKKRCIAADYGAHGVCLDSGAVALGGACTGGDCQGDAHCVIPTGETSGTCEKLCPPFSGDTNGCGAGEVCDIFSPSWGVCTDEVANPKIAPFSPCTTAGTWCDDAIICLTVDAQGNSLCIPVCRPPLGDEDCPSGAACEDGFFEGDVLGLCLPQ